MEANTTTSTVDTDAPWLTKFTDEARARQYAQELERAHPKVPPAYQPSGKRGPLAIPLMFLGSAVGAVAASLGALFVAAIGFLFWGAFSWAASGDGNAMGKLILWLLEVVAFLMGWFGAFAAAGAIASAVVMALGDKGKNRNTTVATIFSVPAALVASAVLVFVTMWLRSRITTPPDMLEFSWAQMVWMLTDVSALHYVGLLLGVGTAAGLAYLMAKSHVAASKYCEACDQAMQHVPLPGVSFDELAELLARDESPSPPLPPARQHPEVDLALHRCARCQHGFFDATAHARVSWPHGASTKVHEASWLCQSFATTPAQTEALARR